MIYDKKELRAHFIKARLGMGETEVRQKSRAICEKAERLGEIFVKKSFALYLAVKNEVNTKKLIDTLVSQKKEVYLPRFFNREKAYFFVKFSDWDELEVGYFGIEQPKNSQKADTSNIDVVFIPGVAFDKKGVRLGWGTGTYDHLLKGLKAIKIGLSYDFQIADALPYVDHDIRVDLIVTEKRTFKTALT